MHFLYKIINANKNFQEQLARWETSETNRLPSIRREVKDSKVKFTVSFFRYFF